VPPLLDVRDVGKVLRASPSKIRDLARKGVLPSLKIGGSVRFRPEDVRAYIESCRTGGGQVSADPEGDPGRAAAGGGDARRGSG
jgi:excisionase family DNA binding protein